MIINFDKAEENAFSHERIIKVVTEHFGMDSKRLEEEPKRRGEVATVRKYACYLLKKYCRKKTLKEIANLVGYKTEGSHATVLFHYNDMTNKLPIYKSMKNEVMDLEKDIQKHFEFLLEIEGYTVADAIRNPKILDRYKRQEEVKR